MSVLTKEKHAKKTKVIAPLVQEPEPESVFEKALILRPLKMNLGYSNEIFVGIPEGITVTSEAGGRLIVNGVDNQKVGEFAAQIRKLRGPEPYKGKGIRYDNEIIRRKVGKSGVK